MKKKDKMPVKDDGMGMKAMAKAKKDAKKMPMKPMKKGKC